MSLYSRDTEEVPPYSRYALEELSSSRDSGSNSMTAFRSTDFLPRSSLQIQAQGMNCTHFPVPNKQLEIPIFSTTSDSPVYLSIRPERRSGSCRLVLADDAADDAIARTTYKFGPGNNPVVRIGQDDDIAADVFEIIGKGLLTRAIRFETRRWGRFEWRYGSKSERAQCDANNLLILEKVSTEGMTKDSRVKVAQLIRNDTFRTPGTNRYAAGNGGRLEMDLGEKNQHIDEVVVVVTCLVMLKREIDRNRATKIGMMSSGAGGL